MYPGVASSRAACEKLGYIVLLEEASSLYDGHWDVKMSIKSQPSLSNGIAS